MLIKCQLFESKSFVDFVKLNGSSSFFSITIESDFMLSPIECLYKADCKSLVEEISLSSTFVITSYFEVFLRWHSRLSWTHDNSTSYFDEFLSVMIELDRLVMSIIWIPRAGRVVPFASNWLIMFITSLDGIANPNPSTEFRRC